MKELFDNLQAIMGKVNDLEDALQGFRDKVSPSTKAPVNESIRGVHALRDLLWKVDKSLENENEDVKGAERLIQDLNGGKGR
jgi:hypothetical protein